MARQPRNFREAAQASLDERWLPMSKAKSIREMKNILNETKCALCELQIRRHPEIFPNKMPCMKCPLTCLKNGEKLHHGCCEEYEYWAVASNTGYFEDTHEAAIALVKRLQKIANGDK